MQQLRGLTGDVQVRSARNHRQRLMGGVAAQICPQIHGMPGGGQEFQIRPVGIVHRQQYPGPAAHRRQRRHVRQLPQIVRAGEIHRRHRLPAASQLPLQLLRGHGPAVIGFSLRRTEPAHRHVQQSGGIDECLVGIASRQQQGLLPPAAGVYRQQMYHGLDAQGGASGGVQGVRPENGPGVLLAPGDDALRVKQIVSAVYLRDVQCLEAQRAAALVAGHMHPHGPAAGVAPDEIADRGAHSVPSSRATATAMAHSMRLRNRSQPSAYTPRTEPVAW